MAVTGWKGRGGSMDTPLTGWEIGSWLPAHATTVTTFLCQSENAPGWGLESMAPIPSLCAPQGGLPNRPLAKSCSGKWCSVCYQWLFLGSYHRGFFNFLWAVLVVSVPHALITYSPKIMGIKHLPEALILKLLSGSLTLVLFGLPACFSSVRRWNHSAWAAGGPYLINCWACWLN